MNKMDYEKHPERTKRVPPPDGDGMYSTEHPQNFQQNTP